MKHFISNAYGRDLHHAATLLLIQRRIAQADVLIDQMENRGGQSGKLRERSRSFTHEAERLFEKFAGDTALLDDSVMRMARAYRDAKKAGVRLARTKRRKSKT